MSRQDVEGLNFVVSENEIVCNDDIDNDVIDNDVSIRVKRATFMPFRSEKFMSKQVTVFLTKTIILLKILANLY